MEAAKSRKGRGGKLIRSKTVAIRLDPKLHYLAELAARKHRRTLSSFIEWAIVEVLKSVVLREAKQQREEKSDITVADEAEKLWDVDEADRLAKLALHYPELLNHDEQRLWKLATEADFLWKGHRTMAAGKSWNLDEVHFQFSNFRLCWDDFQSVLEGNTSAADLPKIFAKRLIQHSGQSVKRGGKKNG